jgi:hypothetical protein
VIAKNAIKNFGGLVMVLKIDRHHPSPVESQSTAQGVSPTENAEVQQTRQSFGIGGTADGFEQAKQIGSLNVESQRYQSSADETYSASELRMLVSAAKAENKTPFSIANLNRLLAANEGKYTEIAADLKGWIYKNMYLTPRQKAPLDRMSQEDLQKIQDSAQSATQLGKRIVVEIENQPAEGSPKVLKLKNDEITDVVKQFYTKVPQSIVDEKLKEPAYNAEH